MEVYEFILFLTLHLLGKYFLNDLWRITTILLLKFVYFDFETNVHFYQKISLFSNNSVWALVCD